MAADGREWQAVNDLAVIVESLVNDKLPTHWSTALCTSSVSPTVASSLVAAMLGVSLSRAIRVGSLKITLGGVSPW
jgi:hypothetical protein